MTAEDKRRMDLILSMEVSRWDYHPRHAAFAYLHNRFYSLFNRDHQVSSKQAVEHFRLMLRLKKHMHYGPHDTPCQRIKF